MPKGDLLILSGSANIPLSEAICAQLKCSLTPTLCTKFSDGEIRIEIGGNVRGADVFLIQPTCSPVNFNLMELCLMLDALKRASVERVTAVIPYYGYARQDRKVVPRAPISAKLVSDFISTAGVDRVMTMDLHAGQIQGFFNCPVDNLFAAPILLDHLKTQYDCSDIVIVSPDAGGVERARAYAKRLDASIAIVDKRRETPNQAKAMNVIGDVENKVCVVLDDMIDTAGTMCAAAEALLKNGATDVIACATHAVLSGPAIERLEKSVFSKIFITDTIPLKENISCKKIEVLSVANLIAQAIYNVHTESSVSTLFK